MIRENQRLTRSGKSALSSIGLRAREQMMADAKRYTTAYRETDWVDERLGARDVSDVPIIMAGHQPTIFHPGVWFKNFTLDHLAKQNGAIPVNLVIDNDVSTSSSLRVPSIDSTARAIASTSLGGPILTPGGPIPLPGRPILRTVPYDRTVGRVPHEQTVIRDREQFDSFDEAIIQAVKPLIENPCIGLLWKHAMSAIDRCGVAGCALAQARHGLEGERGLQTLELPLGVLCRGSAFMEFALTIFEDLPRFVSHYNWAADEYRQANGIRSSAHPVSNLQTQSGWHESPFWVYGNDSPERKPVWAKTVDGWLMLTDNVDGVDESSRTANGSTRLLAVEVSHRLLAAEKLASLVTPEFKLRPRAIVTTMYARLVLSDLFLHGIGGGKYDELGDVIMERFFGVSAPAFMVISATIQLPESIRCQARSMDELHRERTRLMRSIRDTHFQPERFADEAGLDCGLLDDKSRLLSIRDRNKSWHVQISNLNSRLSEALSATRDRLVSELTAIEDELASARLLGSREHPFAVFPIDYLQAAYAKLLR